MSRRGLQTLVAVVAGGPVGGRPRLPHLRGDAWFLDRVEATMADLRTLVRGVRKPPPVVLIVAIDDEIGAPGRQISPQPRHARAHRRCSRAILAEGRGARPAASRCRRRGGRYGAVRGAGPQPQRDRRRGSVRRSQANARRRWRQRAGARAGCRQLRLAARPLFARAAAIGIVNVATDYAGTPRFVPHVFPHPATASRRRFRCRRRRSR